MNARTCRRTAAAVIAALLGAASASAQQPYLFELIADTRSGFTDLSLAPSINANGAVAFRAESAGGGSGIFVGGNGGAPTAIVNNAAGSQFLNFGISDPRINASGAVTFFANRTDGSSGIFLRSGGIVSTIADTNSSFAVGQTFAQFGGPSINNAGTVAFSASSSTGQLGVFTGTAGGAPSRVSPGTAFAAVASQVFINGNAGLAVVGMNAAGETQVLTGAAGGAFSVAATTASPLFSSIELAAPFLTNDGLAVVFVATREDTGVNGIFRLAGGTITTLVDSSGGFQDFRDIALAGDGSLLAFSAVTDDNRVGIFNGSDPLLNKVIASGDFLPAAGLLRQVDSVSLGEAGLNANGQIAFYATFSDALPGDPGFAAIYRATAIPEPGASAFLLMGGAALLIPLRRRIQNLLTK